MSQAPEIKPLSSSGESSSMTPSPGNVASSSASPTPPTVSHVQPVVSEAAKKEKKSKNEEKLKKVKVLKQSKPPKVPRSFRDRLAALMPEHLGDIVFLLLIVALFVGTTLLWFFAWVPTNEAVEKKTVSGIPLFVDEELEKIISILKAREEASTAPVVPPTRDPFR